MKHLLTTIAFAACLTAAAQDNAPFQVGNLWFSTIDGTNTCALTFDYDDEEAYSRLTGTLDIPATVTHNAKTYTVTTIDEGALWACGATTINLPSTITTIGGWAFEECQHITTLNIPASVTSIGQSAFYGCNSLTALNVAPANTSYCTVDGVLFTKDMTTLMAYPAAHGTASYTVPASVTTIDGYAFCYADVTDVSLPAGLTTLTYSTFYACPNLTDIRMNEGLQTIAQSAIGDCPKLVEINIPASVTYINAPCDRCSNLKRINVAAGNTEYCSVDGVLFTKSMRSLTYYPAAHGNVYTVPDGVETIYYNAFYNTPIKAVTLPATIEEISPYAFDNCSQLTDIVFPNNLRVIGERAFRSCSSLVNVVLPEGLFYIHDYAFYNCSNLSSVVLPSTLSEIGEQAFNNDYALGNIYSHALYPATVAQNAFHSCGGSFKSDDFKLTSTCTIHIPASAAVPAYESNGWTGNHVKIQQDGDKPLCATPVISIVDGEINLTCSTANSRIEYEYNGGTSYEVVNGEEYDLPQPVLRVWATAPGCIPSLTASYRISFVPGDTNGDGTLSVGDVTRLIEKLK